MHDYTKVAATSAAEGLEETAFLQGRQVRFADGNKGAVGSKGSFGEGVGAYAEATRKGAKASAKDKATNANSRITTTIDNIAVVVAYNQFRVDVAPLAAGVYYNYLRIYIKLGVLYAAEVKRDTTKGS